MDITGIWAGTMDGTNWGRFLAKFQEADGAISGSAEIVDVEVATYTLRVKGNRSGGMVYLRLSPDPNGVRIYPGTIDVQVTSESEATLRGTWKSSIGTNGTFRADRQSFGEPAAGEIKRKAAESNAAFVIMAFSEEVSGSLPLIDIYNGIKRGCELAGVRAHRADEVEHSGSITNLILDHIRQHRFLISDLTHERPNVYYEVGYAHGLQKEVVLTSHKATPVHFDIAAYNVIFYRSATELQDRIFKRLQARINNAEKIE